ncbi:NAD(P)-binding protein [Hypoxylon sp. FL0890]|nr:NAD(P)-binding protein [Hypoxylon sp. FL0890]
MSRNVCITAVEGHTGHLIADLLLRHEEFPDISKVDSIVGLTLHPRHHHAKELQSLGARIVHHVPGRERTMVNTLKDTGCDTICLVPPAHKDKFDICVELVKAAKKAGIQNVLLISSAGADYADPQRQPRLREFIELESLVLSTKGDPSTPLGHSPCVIRAGFYAENILLYAPQAQSEGILPLPIGKNHKFAPVALGDVTQVAAHVLSGRGQHGFDDKHRGQMMIVTGPQLCAGEELATAASAALGTPMEFEDISHAEAKKVLKAQASEVDESEREYLLEYYSLVREGKTNYIATTAFHDVTGRHPMQPTEFFKTYSEEMRPKKKIKTNQS